MFRVARAPAPATATTAVPRVIARVFPLAIALAVLVAVGGPESAIAQGASSAPPNLNGAPLIFDVRRSLPLEPDETVFHDFYINAGPEAGFRKGMYINVVRQVPVHDPVQNKQQATLSVNVARLQVIHVERSITVARLNYEYTDEERPTLEFESVMIGDRIDPGSATMDAPSTGKKKTKVPAKAALLIPLLIPAPAAASPAAGVAPALLPQSEKEVEKLPASVGLPGEAKNTTPTSSAADMVRVPIPGTSAATKKL